MASESQSHDMKTSQELQAKFEFYLIALVFTLLGLSIQTAKFGVNVAANIYEILGWVSLLASGLIALWRIEWVPVALATHSKSVQLQNEKAQLEVYQSQGITTVLVGGAPTSITEVIDDRVVAIAKAETRISEIEGGVRTKYWWHRWLFVAGVVLVVIARAYIPVYEILHAVT